MYEENSCLYLFNRQTLELRRNRIGERPYMFEIDKTEARILTKKRISWWPICCLSTA